MFNTYSKKEREFGGFHPVWLEVTGMVQIGGTIPTAILNRIPSGCMIETGTLCAQSVMGGDVTPFLGYEPKTISAGKIIAHAPSHGIIPVNTDKLVAVDHDGTERDVVVSSSKINVDGDLEITVTETPTGVFFYLNAAPKASGYNVKGLTRNDAVIKDGTYAGTLGVVDAGRVLGSRVPTVPNYYKAMLNTIKFEMEDGVTNLLT